MYGVVGPLNLGSTWMLTLVEKGVVATCNCKNNGCKLQQIFFDVFFSRYKAQTQT
jgi:hypothetical protein